MAKAPLAPSNAKLVRTEVVFATVENHPGKRAEIIPEANIVRTSWTISLKKKYSGTFSGFPKI